ncbi:MAG TPA: hypothetical protein VGG33_17140, partial [Polyangia bacterium]
RVVLYSAISLDEAEMRELEAFARPAFLIVPSAIHRMDARPWKSRYPTIQVITPAGAREKVQEVVDVDATTVDFGDPSVRFFAVPGTGNGDAALVIERAGGTTLVLNDIIFDLENRPGLKGWLFRKVGMTADEPHIPTPIRLLGVKDKGALATQLEAWGRLPELRRVIISHGDIIAEQPGEVLTRVARDLRSV